jgi:hypothetical protein
VDQEVRITRYKLGKGRARQRYHCQDRDDLPAKRTGRVGAQARDDQRLRLLPGPVVPRQQCAPSFAFHGHETRSAFGLRRTPKAFQLIAQGCREAATLGNGVLVFPIDPMGVAPSTTIRTFLTKQTNHSDPISCAGSSAAGWSRRVFALRRAPGRARCRLPSYWHAPL